MKTYRCIVQLLLLCPEAAPGPLVAQTPEADKRDIVDQIRHSYYNLAAQGLLELHCRATPDWTAVYKQVSVDTEHDKLLPLVKGLISTCRSAQAALPLSRINTILLRLTNKRPTSCERLPAGRSKC